MNRDVLVNLNNAIVRLASVSGRGSDAQRLADDWSEWFHGSALRSMGPLFVPVVWGAANGYWERYRDAYDKLSKAEHMTVSAPPDSVEPTLKRLLGTATDQVVESHQAVAREAKKQAKQGVAAAAEAYETVERKVVGGVWLVAIPLLLAVFLARRN